MKPTEEQKAAARHNLRQYEASMAIEDMHLSDRDREVLEQCIEEGLSGEEAQARIIQSLKNDGLISADTDGATLAAE